MINFESFTGPFIIAEMSGNHNQSIDKAFEIIDAAADAGADAIKIQTYTADTITLQNVFKISEPSSPWFDRDLYDLYDEAHTPWDWHEAIFTRARERGLICFSSPFDETAVSFLESIDNPIYKIASFEINHIPLLKCIAKTGKPVIMSTGASTLSEIEEAVATLRKNGCDQLILLKCTSTYPATSADSNILTIPHMSELFSCKVGISDHTLGIGVSVGAVALGAVVIEKHFCLDRSAGGVDASFSMEPEEFKLLVKESKQAYLARGKISYGLSENEKKVDAGKRSIYASEDINQGDLFTLQNTKIIRPGYGLHPRFMEDIIGKKAAKDLKKGTALSWLDVK